MQLEDYGVIGNCQYAALIERTGAVGFCCWPRFDSEPVFAKLLDKEDGGAFTIRPASGALGTQRYFDNTNVIETHFGRIEDLRTDNSTNKNTDQLGYTDAAIDLHTDQPFLDDPPRLQVLQSIRPAEIGGDNYLVDAFAAARYLESLERRDADILRSVPVRFDRRQREFQSVVEAPILSERATGPIVRYSYFTMAPHRLPFAEMEAFYRAYDRFARIVRDPRHQYRFGLRAGDFLVYDNHRMLHARTAFEGARWVRGVYFDSESRKRS